MQPWMIFIIVVIACRIAGLILRRFSWGSWTVLILSKLFFLFVLGVLGLFLDNFVLRQFGYAFALIFVSTPIFVFAQSMYQMLGDMIVSVKFKSKPPTIKTHVQKGEYILPFTGKWTVFNGGVDEKLLHGGSASQKYAYDFIVVDDEGKSYNGNKRDVQSYHCYSKDIVAIADGVVVTVRKNAKDSFVDGLNAYCDSIDLRGNYIVIKHFDNEYSTVAHLMPGSVSVNIGDSVKQGEVIAKCGNSGNSSEPHIHFQLQTGKSFFLSAGLPIAFSNIETQDKVNYNLIDTRPHENNLLVEGGKTYIGRGLEAWNR